MIKVVCTNPGPDALLPEYMACIFELHSYFENRPFFVEVKSVH